MDYPRRTAQVRDAVFQNVSQRKEIVVFPVPTASPVRRVFKDLREVKVPSALRARREIPDPKDPWDPRETVDTVVFLDVTEFLVKLDNWERPALPVFPVAMVATEQTVL